MNLTVAVLAGGKSERMGQDKALLPAAGSSSLLEHVVREAWDATALPVLIVGRARPENWLLGDKAAVFVPDDEWPGVGPLGGLQTALRHANGASVLALACDLPKMTAAALRWLLDKARAAYARGELGDGLATQNGAQIEPLFSVYAASCLPLLDARLAQDRRSLHGLIEAGDFSRLIAPPEVAAALVNVNTPEEWQRYGWGTWKP